MDSEAPPGRLTPRVLWCLNVAALLAATVMAYVSWRGVMADAEAHASTRAWWAGQTTAQILDQAALAVISAVDHLEAPTPTRELTRDWVLDRIDTAAARLPDLHALLMFDERGHQVCGPLKSFRCQNLQLSQLGFANAAPLEIDRSIRLHGPTSVAGQTSSFLVLSKIHLDSEGKPAGQVVALVATQRLKAITDEASLGPTGRGDVRKIDFESLVPDPGQGKGAASQRMAPLNVALEHHPWGGVFQAASADDGVSRIVAYRRLARWPLFVTVEDARSEVITRWYPIALLLVVGVVLLGVGSVALARSHAGELHEHRRAQALYEDSPCAHHTLDANGKYLSVNATGLAWLGCTRDEVVGKLGPKDFLTEEGRALFEQHFPTLLSGRAVEKVEVDWISRQGVRRRVVINARAVFDEQGKFAFTNSAMYDITELDATKRDLKTMAEKQEHMLQSDLFGMAKVKAGRMVWANRGMEAMFGYASSEWPGMSVRRLCFADEQHTHARFEGWELTQPTGFPRMEIPMRHKGGTTIWVEVGGTALGSKAGEVLLLMLDIGAKKAVEASRLREAALSARHAQLQEVTKLKDQLLSVASHELRTPLNGILGLSQLLAGQPAVQGSAKASGYLAELQSSAWHLFELIEAQLDLLALNSGTLTMMRRHVMVRDMLAEVVKGNEPKAALGGVTLTTRVDERISTVWVDAARWRQAVHQLVSNAIKFSPRGGQVQILVIDLGQGRWCTDVIDSGSGVPSDRAEAVFSPFVQLSTGINRQHGGLGIGLTLARGLARAMGGDVLLSPSAGQGSSFRLELPLSDGGTAAPTVLLPTSSLPVPATGSNPHMPS